MRGTFERLLTFYRVVCYRYEYECPQLRFYFVPSPVRWGLLDFMSATFSPSPSPHPCCCSCCSCDKQLKLKVKFHQCIYALCAHSFVFTFVYYICCIYYAHPVRRCTYLLPGAVSLMNFRVDGRRDGMRRGDRRAKKVLRAKQAVFSQLFDGNAASSKA